MVNLSFSLPGDVHKCGMGTDTGEEILTRVATAPNTKVIIRDTKHAVSGTDLKKRGKSAPNNISHQKNYENNDVIELFLENGTIGNNAFHPVSTENFKQSEDENELTCDQPQTEMFFDLKVDHPPIHQNSDTVSTLPGEVIEDISAQHPLPLLRERTLHQDQKGVSCFYNYFWIKPLDICCSCLGALYD